MKFLVTGVAGFIGSQTAMALLARGHHVLGIDNLNTYYSTKLKQARLDQLHNYKAFQFEMLDLCHHETLLALPRRDDIDRVIHFAAQAGVRYSITNPFAYATSNLIGHLSVLEFCRHAAKAPLLIYASSSSVYGNGLNPPFAEDMAVDQPVSLYAATKRADELISAAYTNLYDIAQIGIRFFTVYGPWGRPDMAYWTFTERILRNEAIRVFNNGQLKRDFTYIDDAVAGVLAIAENEPDFTGLSRPHKLYNIGHNKPVSLLDFIAQIERSLSIRARMTMEPMQPGDVCETCADIRRMQTDYGYCPKTSLDEGLDRFVAWFRQYGNAVTG